MPAPLLAGLAIAGPPDPWERLGFTVTGGECRVGTTLLRFGCSGEGVRSWTLAGAGAGEGDVDGLPTEWVAAPAPVTAPERHPNGALRLDHVVVATPDLARTLAALAAAGLELRRTREAGTPEQPLRQAFFRLGQVILEVVGQPDATGDGPASFWGLVAVVADLDACVARLGADAGTIREAVQPGRRIATVRRSAGVGVALALMTP